MKRPTIADIAKAAGVSTGAVSYALNNRPGVSESTRARIQDIADRLGWVPNRAARALSDGRAGAIGLVIDRPARAIGVEPYFMQLVSGIQDALADGTTSLLLQVTDNAETELTLYRRWWAERRVDGVLLVDLRADDPRVDLVTRLGLPAVIFGEPVVPDGPPCVWTDDAVAMVEVLRHLAGLGHRRVGRIAGPAEFVHTRSRSRVFLAEAERLGLAAGIINADYSAEDAGRATRQALGVGSPPSALVFDNDVMAVAALGVAQELGFAVPEDLSIVAWDDSTLCSLVRPALTAVRRPIVERGAAAVRLLLSVIEGVGGGHLRTADPVLVVRGSTGAV
ncbi:LacI family DNA-binding transcriptional regulator [Actinokineospora fastidiosa]|uniref:LacI family transcriptional regulator n=1 Tax=Actinokineospora fastidiosa TaxID=1816 RepID=A0A918GEJ3_9PSEU|nr:LacI family DNA-binding transcriptional regulator [Actinokineospora fastidiosa]GGS32820.1 LacI family transcriptional regulator [Actinokineospora fastidiosa]